MMRTPEDLPPVPGLRRGDVRQYEEPGLGWSVPFFGEELTATVYVYPGTSKPGKPAKRLAKEFDDAVMEIVLHARERGVEFVPLRESPGRVDSNNLDPAARRVSFLLRGSSESGHSSVFGDLIMANAGDVFLKVRCSYTPNLPKKSGFQINGLLNVLKPTLQPF
jgi:hypothetical protein